MTPDELVNRYVMRTYRTENTKRERRGSYGEWVPKAEQPHLVACPEAVADATAEDGVYGCETGCDYARFEATISCPHGFSEQYEYGQFGELSYILEDLEKDYP